MFVSSRELYRDFFVVCVLCTHCLLLPSFTCLSPSLSNCCCWFTCNKLVVFVCVAFVDRFNVKRCYIVSIFFCVKFQNSARSFHQQNVWPCLSSCSSYIVASVCVAFVDHFNVKRYYTVSIFFLSHKFQNSICWRERTFPKPVHFTNKTCDLASVPAAAIFCIISFQGYYAKSSRLHMRPAQLSATSTNLTYWLMSSCSMKFNKIQ